MYKKVFKNYLISIYKEVGDIMPSIITHDIFAKMVLAKLNIKDAEMINKAKQIYLTFAQSHDYLFHYCSFNYKKTKLIRKIGKKGHKEKTQAYFIALINNIKKHNLQNYAPAIAYLYGSITHYVLDSTCHPFIFYKTGTYHKNKKDSHKYHGEHAHIEKDLDAYYYKKYFGRDYKYCNVSKEIIKNPIFDDELINLINETYHDVYNEDKVGYYYKKSITKAKIIYSLFINDRFGIKRAIYKLIDKITKHKFGYLSAYSTHINDVNNNFLNLDHKEWNHPCFKDKTYNYSFDDLLEVSLNKCQKIIKVVNSVLYKNNDINLLKKSIPNISYSTGLDLDNNRAMHYFEY